jgi:hypothetical protein
MRKRCPPTKWDPMIFVCTLPTEISLRNATWKLRNATKLLSIEKHTNMIYNQRFHGVGSDEHVYIIVEKNDLICLHAAPNMKIK